MVESQEELEYHVTFPDSNTPKVLTSGRNINADDFVFVYEEQKRPLVVLLGWAGCQDKYLAKYSAIYEERRLAYYNVYIIFHIYNIHP